MFFMFSLIVMRDSLYCLWEFEGDSDLARGSRA